MNELTLQAQFRKGPLCFDEFLDLVPDERKADLLDGVIYLASPEYPEANKLLVWLCTITGLFVERKALGDISLSGVAYRLDLQNGPSPISDLFRRNESTSANGRTLTVRPRWLLKS